MMDMSVVYDFIESIHLFIPVIAVVLCVVIIYFCGIGGAQNPPEEYLEKIQSAYEDPGRIKKKKTAPRSSQPLRRRSASFSPEKDIIRKLPNQKSAISGQTKQQMRSPAVNEVLSTTGDPNSNADGEWVVVNRGQKRRERKQQNVEFGETGSEIDTGQRSADEFSPKSSPHTQKDKKVMESNRIVGLHLKSNDVNFTNQDEHPSLVTADHDFCNTFSVASTSSIVAGQKLLGSNISPALNKKKVRKQREKEDDMILVVEEPIFDSEESSKMEISENQQEDAAAEQSDNEDSSVTDNEEEEADEENVEKFKKKKKKKTKRQKLKEIAAFNNEDDKDTVENIEDDVNLSDREKDSLVDNSAPFTLKKRRPRRDV